MIRGVLAAILCSVPFSCVAAATCPDSFSPRAKELLADSVELMESEHKLNVIYFIGNDNEPAADYERRLSELLLYLQQFYGKEMARNGYGNRSFGLPMLPNGMVDITVVRGKESHKKYYYSGEGAELCLKELEEYYAKHPEKKRSQHNFVIMRTHYDDKHNDANPGGVPFFGYGVHCFALDYVGFDIEHLGQDTTAGHLLTKWYGGFAHELGHGLNLPHNNGTRTQNTELGTPLMNSGNYTFGYKPTYLTPASCSILARSETFALKGNKTPYYAYQQQPEVEALHVAYDGDSIHISLRCTENHTVNAYVQDPPFAVNQDYDAVVFRVPEKGPAQAGKQLHVVSIPLDELGGLKNIRHGEQRVDLRFCAPDGSRYRTYVPIQWENLKPGDVIPCDKLEFVKGY